MSEEEIIEKIRDNVTDNESTYILCDALEDIIKNNNKKYDIQIIVSGLLDIYQQEKEKNKELKEYKKISELTKISCCTAQNCEALNNAIREGLENQKLRDKLEESESRLQEEINEVCKLKAELYGNSISKDKIRELKEKTHKTLDGNGITRAYQLEIDGYFNKVLEEE